MSDSQFIWMDGELVPYGQAVVPVLSHSLHYGSAAFEGVRAYRTADGRTAIFKVREHMQRFIDSARMLGGEVPYTLDALVEAIKLTVLRNGFDECYIRPLAYIGDDFRGLKLPSSTRMHVAIAVWRWGKYLGADSVNKGIRVHIASFRRPDPASSLPWAKLSGNYLNSIMARREATLFGMDEAVLLDQHGYVAEGSGENIFVLQKGELLTPGPEAILPGLTRTVATKLAAMRGLSVREARLTRNQLYQADEVFFTGTAAEITPVCEIDGRQIGAGVPGPITRTLADLFEQCVRGRLPEFGNWLTFIE